ncbi:MAG: hypothetical protein FJ285_01440 [Planctomycetes bacterium]|nr:hypothetical protein [Planctomycetota bacterium]
MAASVSASSRPVEPTDSVHITLKRASAASHWSSASSAGSSAASGMSGARPSASLATQPNASNPRSFHGGESGAMIHASTATPPCTRDATTRLFIGVRSRTPSSTTRSNAALPCCSPCGAACST